MTTIRQRILTPFVMIILAMAVATLVFFNVAMRIYADRLARDELRSTVAGIEGLVRSQVFGNLLDSLNGDSGDSSAARLLVLRSALRLTKLSSHTEFVVLGPAGAVLFPQNLGDSFLTSEVIARVTARLAGAAAGEVVRVQTGTATYFATSRATPGIVRSSQVIYIASANMFRGITGVINLVLLGIMVVTAIVASVTAAGVASGISRPISRLSLHAKQLGSGGFAVLPADDSSLETAELTKSINDMSDRLRKYDQAQKDFLQNASHELRTPLMSIGGYAEGLVTGVFADTKGTAAIICEESRRMNTLVEELLTLSRIENGSSDVHLQTVNICDFMKDCVQKTGGLALKHGKLLTLECASADVTAHTDEGLLRQIVLNVIANGLKYAAKQVSVSVGRADGRPLIRIADDGDGIAAGDLPHIFERFYKGKGGNFGLGLAIAESAAKAIGATIRAHNDGGAVFEISV